MLSTECIRALEYLLAIMTQRLWNLKQLSWHVDAPPATSYRESLATESQITPALWASVQHWRPDAVPPTGRETFLSYTGPEGALADGLKQVCKRDAQRPRQSEQILEGRVPASRFNPAQVRPVHLGQFRQALLGQASLAERLPGCRVVAIQRSELGLWRRHPCRRDYRRVAMVGESIVKTSKTHRMKEIGRAPCRE